MHQIDAEEGAYVKNDGALQRCFGVIRLKIAKAERF